MSFVQLYSSEIIAGLGGSQLNLELVSAPVTPEIAVLSEQSIAFWAAPGVRASGIIDSHGFRITLLKETPNVASLIIGIGETSRIEVGSGGGVITQDGVSYGFNYAGCALSDFQGSIKVDLIDSVSSITFFESQGGFRQFSMGMLSTGVTSLVMPLGARPVEWSIAVFDDAAMLSPRPIRQGVPVISTVPVNGASLDPNDVEMISLGIGLSTRQMYFKALSSLPIPAGINATLLIYLPNGLDTLTAPVQIPMTRMTTSESDDTRTGFYASYEFHAEDTKNYVDGFAYLGVFIPTVINGFLPFEFQVTTDGTPYSANSLDDPTTY